MNKDCKFCNSTSNIYDEVIDETKYFTIKPSLGSLVDGYLLIISKRHITSMSQLTLNEKKEYFEIINKYRNIFFDIYKKYPIIFEHGTLNEKTSASSVIHAHTHIVNHCYKEENNIIEKLHFHKINNLRNYNKSYIFYISNNNEMYITYKFKPISQMMRIFIAEDLDIKEKFNWRNDPFENNIIKTINAFKKVN